MSKQITEKTVLHPICLLTTFLEKSGIVEMKIKGGGVNPFLCWHRPTTTQIAFQNHANETGKRGFPREIDF